MTSRTIGRTSRPSSDAAAAAPRSASREPSHTVIPCSASRRAAVRPSPLFAPVMSAMSVMARPCAPPGHPARAGAAQDRRYQAGGRAGVHPGTVDRTELASALRQWRERLAPGDVGLVAGARRRTPGLRREEVAGLAGVSVDYLTRLEQGRGPHPSDAVLTAVSRALRLSAPEHEHLVRLAGRSPAGPDHIRDTVRPSVQRLMDRLADLPVLVVNARGDVGRWAACDGRLSLLGVSAALRRLLWSRQRKLLWVPVRPARARGRRGWWRPRLTATGASTGPRSSAAGGPAAAGPARGRPGRRPGRGRPRAQAAAGWVRAALARDGADAGTASSGSARHKSFTGYPRVGDGWTSAASSAGTATEGRRLLRPPPGPSPGPRRRRFWRRRRAARRWARI